MNGFVRLWRGSPRYVRFRYVRAVNGRCAAWVGMPRLAKVRPGRGPMAALWQAMPRLDKDRCGRIGLGLPRYVKVRPGWGPMAALGLGTVWSPLAGYGLSWYGGQWPSYGWVQHGRPCPAMVGLGQPWAPMAQSEGTIMESYTPRLGQLPTANDRRDAIHIAIAPVTAGQLLQPGQRVGRLADGRFGASDDTIGLVDPWLREPVQEGQVFWLCLDPYTIESLRHVWTHRAFRPALPSGG